MEIENNNFWSDDTHSESVFDAINLIHDFLSEFFSDAHEVLRFNMNFLESHGFKYQTEIDYMKLNRFVSAAYNAISANDYQVIDVLLNKFYKDIVFLNSFYKDFNTRGKDPLVIFKNQFIPYYGGISKLSKRLMPKDIKDEEITDNYIDQISDFFRDQFETIFAKEFSSFNDKLRLIINTKTYYFDSLLWTEARKSQNINEFFKKAKSDETNLNEPLSTKIYIKQYMKTIDKAQTKNQQWHAYLEKVLKIMD